MQNFEIAQLKTGLKRSFALVTWAISGEPNNEQHEHKNMILIWFKTFEQ